MSRVVVAHAPAKINRELRVGPRRPDGYHDIRSRFASIDLADRLEAEESPRLEVLCESEAVPADASNLVARAAERLAARLAVAPRVRVRLVKNVPVGAGLGGGSSDAAATLRLLLRLWERALPESELAALGAELGSDVPFFLCGGEADVAGRGERVSPRADDAPPRELVLVVPPISLSTAAVYAAFDRLPAVAPPPERLEIETSGRFLGPNDLERAVAAIRPEMRTLLEEGRAIARECAMTGSGSTVVLVDPPEEEVARLVARHPGSRAIATRTTTRADFARRVAGEGAEA